LVGPDGKISKRKITISGAQNNKWVVLDGLKAGEQVVVDGFQKLQRLPPGATVNAVAWQPPGTAPAPAMAASAPASSAMAK
jgi:membrane fusion protein (multidrug efflux system)